MMSTKVFKAPILTGYLEKKKSGEAFNTMNKWVKRWWCLREDRLCYFFDKTEVDPRYVNVRDTIYVAT
jgi:hypothetical protein